MMYERPDKLRTIDFLTMKSVQEKLVEPVRLATFDNFKRLRNPQLEPVLNQVLDDCERVGVLTISDKVLYEQDPDLALQDQEVRWRLEQYAEQSHDLFHVVSCLLQ